jgi:hypothetical protein
MQRLILLALIPLFACAALAQERKAALSPRDSVFFRLDTNIVSVNYGRPSMRGRRIMGDLVPWYKVWRTGANEATHLKTNFDMVIGRGLDESSGVPLMKGTYTLWTIPSPEGWTFVINKQTKQWGTDYDERQDYARFEGIVEQMAAPVETLTVAFDGTSATSGRLKVMWENTLVWARFEKNDKIRPVSPPDSAQMFLNNYSVKVRYSKPFARGRQVWGVVVPFDSIWRTGANAATELHLEAATTIGGVKVPAGTYTLYSKPTAKSCTLIISKKAPGRAEYDKTQDLAHIEMTMKWLDQPVDPFTIKLEPTSQKNIALLKFSWAAREYVVDVVVQ